MINKILIGHNSPETAYLVESYPYGFRLRCKIRYWLEVSAMKGVRFVSQTTNPKLAGDVWNKPKASTYSRFGGAMYLNENNHVRWCGVNEYCDQNEMTAFKNTFYAGIPEAFRPVFDKWMAAKIAYDNSRVVTRIVAAPPIAISSLI